MSELPENSAQSPTEGENSSVNEHAFETSLEAFSGPLDLLLYLIKINEVDIYDIPIAKITAQYITMVEVIKQIDMDQAAEFLIMASSLLEIKSKILIPREEIELEDIEDPRQDLVEKLLEYRKVREMADDLGQRFQLRREQFDRVLGSKEQKEAAGPAVYDDHDLEDLEVWDLFRIFEKISKETLIHLGNFQIKENEVSTVEYFMIVSRSIRESQGQTSFRQLIKEAPDRVWVVGLFVSLLEMTRQGKVTLKQSDDFDDIDICDVSSPSTPPPNDPTSPIDLHGASLN